MKALAFFTILAVSACTSLGAQAPLTGCRNTLTGAGPELRMETNCNL